MRENFPEKRLLNIKEVAHYLGISVQTIRNHLCKGTFPIPPIRICGSLRWDIRTVDKYINTCRPLTKPAKSTREDDYIPSIDDFAGEIRKEGKYGSL